MDTNPHTDNRLSHVTEFFESTLRSLKETGKILEPEFGDAKKVRAIFDISKTHLYRLEEAGLIKSASVPGRGKTKGRRLYNIASIRAFLHRCMAADTQPEEVIE